MPWPPVRSCSGWASPGASSPSSRARAWSTTPPAWSSIASPSRRAPPGGSPRQSAAVLIGSAVLVAVVVIVARLAWVAVATSVQRLLAHYSLLTYHWAGWRNALLVAWAGMRGAVSLAAALALPMTLANGTPFPVRSQLIGVTFGVILVTLVGQGLSLTPLIRMLGVQGEGETEQELLQARRVLTMSALARLEELALTAVMAHTVVP